MYWIIFGITILLSLAASAYLKRVYARASRVPIASGLTGAQAASRILQSAGITDVSIVEGESFLGDHYDPLNKRLVLSPDNYTGSSAAQVGVAAHECGHALQHQQHYFPLQLRMGSVYATNFASNAVFYIVPMLMFFRLVSVYVGLWFMAAGLGVVMLFNLVTLPVEFDASARAKVVLQRLGIIQTGEEAAAVSQTLNAAGLTYVAAFIGILLQFLYYVALLSGNRSRN
jgi:hypothetical protein